MLCPFQSAISPVFLVGVLSSAVTVLVIVIQIQSCMNVVQRRYPRQFFTALKSIAVKKIPQDHRHTPKMERNMKVDQQ